MALGSNRQNPYEARTKQSLGTGTSLERKKISSSAPKAFETMKRTEAASSPETEKKKDKYDSQPSLGHTKVDDGVGGKSPDVQSTRVDESDNGVKKGE